MPIEYKIFKDLNLLYTIFNGWVDKDEAMHYAREVYNSRDFEYASNTLVLLKKSQIVFDVEDVEEFAKQIIDNIKFRFRRKIAILVENPFDTVAATIYAQTLITFRKGVDVELFYTIEAALAFLGLSDQKEIIEQLINQNSSILNKE